MHLSGPSVGFLPMKASFSYRGSASEKRLEAIALAAFIVLFPGFFVYHFSVGLTPMTPFLGGLFGYASVVVLACVMLVSSFGLRYTRVSQPYYVWFVYGFILYAVFWTFIHSILIRDEPYIHTAVLQAASTWMFLFVSFWIAYEMPISSTVLRRGLWVFLCSVALFLFGYVLATGNAMFYARQVFGVEDIATYQGFARSVLVAALVLFSLARTVGAQIVVLAMGMFALFVLGARSELVGFVFAVSLVMMLSSRVDWRYIAVPVAGLVVMVLVLGLLGEWLGSSRQAELFDLSESGSWARRVELQAVALGQIASSWVIGDFGGHVRAESVGGYAHNALSAWVSLGVLGFVAYVGLTVWAWAHSGYRVWRHGMGDRRWVVAFVFGSAVVLLIVAAKSVFWPVVGLLWGFYGRALANRSRIRSNNLGNGRIVGV